MSYSLPSKLNVMGPLPVCFVYSPPPRHLMPILLHKPVITITCFYWYTEWGSLPYWKEKKKQKCKHVLEINPLWRTVKIHPLGLLQRRKYSWKSKNERSKAWAGVWLVGGTAQMEGKMCHPNDHRFPPSEAQVGQWYHGWQERNDYYYFRLQDVPITEPYNTCTETNTCFNIYSLGPESMMVQLSILPQPSGKCLTKQMALPGFFSLG